MNKPDEVARHRRDWADRYEAMAREAERLGLLWLAEKAKRQAQQWRKEADEAKYARTEP